MDRRFIIDRRTNRYLNSFEYLVMSLAIWNAIWTPLTIAFKRAQELDERPGIVAINAFVDTIFWLDILL